MSESILTAVDLHKTYGDLNAVNGVSLKVVRGEVLGLLGPNGAGKTTTISMLTGLLEPTHGRVEVDGEILNSTARKVKAKIGLVPQDLALYPTLSARRNLFFFGRLYGLGGRKLKDRVNEVLELIGLTDRADEAISKYSGGMKRRINIGAGLLHKPAILFLDEPTVGVDPQSRNAIFEGVEKLNQLGMTIIYTTHYMEEAQRLCNRVAIMDEGKIVELNSPQGLIQSLGGGIIFLRLDNAVSSPVTDEVTGLPSVKHTEIKDGQLIIETHQLNEALTGMLEITSHLDAKITSLELLEPNLESVFLHLTGKKLRE